MQTPRNKQTWDPFVRVFHWSLVAFFFLAYFLEGDWLLVHSWAGYTVALLVGFRILWGFTGPEHARFGQFVRGPAPTAQYLRDLVLRRAARFEGHDPAGAAMIVALLASLLIVTATGTTLFAMEGRGPLAGSFVTGLPGQIVEDLHELFADITVGLIVVHVAGVLFASWLHRENLIQAMLTGRKKP